MSDTHGSGLPPSNTEAERPYTGRYRAFGVYFTPDELNATMYRSCWDALTLCGVGHIRLPRYRTVDFLKVKNIVRYKSFRNQVQNMNPFPINRRQMDTCWMKILCKHFQKWDPVSADVEKSERVDTAREDWKYRMLGDAIDQVCLLGQQQS
jgi:hypothetical protein